MIRRVTYLLFFLILTGTGKAQTGGDNVYEFLNLTYSAFAAATGGTNVSVCDNDLNLAYNNPALLSSEMDRSLALNYVNYFAGINYGMTMFSLSYPGYGNFAGGITYLNYGSFRETDEAGNITGTFTAAEYAMSLMYSRTVDTLFSFGVNLKPVSSHLEKYTSFGLALDAGASYHSRDNLFSAGIVLRNIGLQITTYAGENREKVPFEIQAGVSKKLAHAPFRFSLTLRHLEKFDLTHTYEDQADNPEYQGGSVSEFTGNLFRHMIFGVEVIPHKNFHFAAGYNYQRRSELKIDTRTGAAGFSWGFGINTSWLSLDFGRATFHLAGASNHISLILKPDLLFRKLRR